MHVHSTKCQWHPLLDWPDRLHSFQQKVWPFVTMTLGLSINIARDYESSLLVANLFKKNYEYIAILLPHSPLLHVKSDNQSGVLKVSKSQKQIMASRILPKNERWGNFQYIKLHQPSFFGRIQDNIFFFKIFWPLNTR